MIKVIDAGDTKVRQLQASVLSLSEVQRKRPYLSIKMRMCSTKPNENDEAVNESFIDKIVNNEKDYLALPLMADVQKINRGDYRNGLGHMYDAKNKKFLSTQIGGFVSFEKVNDEYGVSLIGEARVYKRNEKVTDALLELYRENALAFSFEIVAGSVTIEDGIMTVGDSDKNELIAMAVVSRPAYKEAVALDLVAEKHDDSSAAKTEEEEDASSDETMVAETTLHMIARWVRMAFWKRVNEGREEDKWFGYNCCFIAIGVDTALIFNEETGKLYRLEYTVQEDGVFITDTYEVEATRVRDVSAEPEKEESEEQELDKMNEPVLEQAEVKTEAQVQAEQKPEEATEKEVVVEASAEETTETEAHAAETPTLAELEEKLATQATRIAELEAKEAKWDAYEREQADIAMANKRTKAGDYAKKSGLDVADAVVASAIESLDYEKLMNLIIEAEAKESEQEEVIATAEKTVNPMVVDMKVGTSWLYEKN